MLKDEKKISFLFVMKPEDCHVLDITWFCTTLQAVKNSSPLSLTDIVSGICLFFFVVVHGLLDVLEVIMFGVKIFLWSTLYLRIVF